MKSFIDIEQESADMKTNEQIAHNNGLSYEDWQDWFASCDKTKPLAIIHFTSFRYSTSRKEVK